MNTIRAACLSTLAWALLAAPVAAAPPSLLGYQGRILVNGTPHDGNGYFKFALTGPTETFWSNDGTGLGSPGTEPLANVPVTVSNGLYSVLLGSAPMVRT